jgi:hypothetical protein
MKRFLSAFVLSLGLLAASAWLIANPAWAGSYTITCADGSTRTCSGSSCVGSDDGPTASQRGHCQCSNSDGTYSIKNCPYRTDLGGGDGGGGDIVPVLQ